MISPAPSQATLLLLTATLGKSAWLEETVSSVAAHAGPSVAHVLIAPPAEIGRLRERFPHCVVLGETADAAGLYGALNQGLQTAREWGWRWMTFLADDDLLLPGFNRLFQKADASTAPGMAALWHGEVVMVNALGERLCRVPYARWSRDIVPLVAAGYSPFNQQGMLYSRTAVERTGLFPAEMRVCADAAHWLRALQGGTVFHRVGEIAAAFRVRPGQLSGNLSVHRAEFAGLRHHARRLYGDGPLWPAVLRFRVANALLYLERIRRVGFTSGFDLLKAT